MAGQDRKNSELVLAITDLAGVIMEGSRPDGEGEYESGQILIETFLAKYLGKATYDPDLISQDVFDSLFQKYDNSISGVSATDVQNAIDEAFAEIDNIITLIQGTSISGIATGGGISNINVGDTGLHRKVIIDYTFTDSINSALEECGRIELLNSNNTTAGRLTAITSPGFYVRTSKNIIGSTINLTINDTIEPAGGNIIYNLKLTYQNV